MLYQLSYSHQHQGFYLNGAGSQGGWNLIR